MTNSVLRRILCEITHRLTVHGRIMDTLERRRSVCSGDTIIGQLSARFSNLRCMNLVLLPGVTASGVNCVMYNCRHLVELNLSYTTSAWSRADVTSRGICKVQNSVGKCCLKKLTIRGWDTISSNTFECLMKGMAIEELILANAGPLDDEVMKFISTWTNKTLRKFEFSLYPRELITTDGFDCLANCTGLQELSLNYRSMMKVGSLARVGKKWEHLTKLKLERCFEIPDRFWQEIWVLTNLQVCSYYTTTLR